MSDPIYEQLKLGARIANAKNGLCMIVRESSIGGTVTFKPMQIGG